MITPAAFSAAWETIPRGYSYRENDGVGLFTLPAFDALGGIKHGFSARMGGLSTGHLASLNLSFSRDEDSRERVMQNYRIFCKVAGIDENSMVMDNFAHGVRVQRVDKSDAGRGYTRPPLPPCDGLITNDPAVTLITGHADCMAIYLYDPVHAAIGLAHAGWRGALGRIGAGVVQAMQQAYAAEPQALYAGIGPSICANCFAVDGDVADAFNQEFSDTPCVKNADAPGKYKVDLWMVALRQLMDTGLNSDHISLMGVCSFEDNRLYSHRRDKGLTGGMAAFLSLNPAKA